MAKSSLQKAIEKQAKESQKAARAAARRETAQSVVSGAEFVAGFRVMDEESEVLLQEILSQYDGNERNYVKFSSENLPRYIGESVSLGYEKLKQYGMISTTATWGNGAMITLSETGKKYFEKKQAALDKVAEDQEDRLVLMDSGMENKILISHASDDQEYMELLIKLLESLRFPNGTIICSSIPGYGIPGGKKIYEWLKEQFLTCNLHVIFALSDNYYASAACLNEMGATWVTKSSSTLFLLPGFRFSDIRGCVDATEVGISIDSNDAELKHRLNELKNSLLTEFSLELIEDIRWEEARDTFIREMREIGKNRSEECEAQSETYNAESMLYIRKTIEPKSIPVESAFLLVYAASDRGEIIISTTLSGTQISAGRFNFVRSNAPRDVAKWKEALNNLVQWGWVHPTGRKGNIYEVTGTGYDKADWLKEEMQIDVEQDPIKQMKEYDL